MDMNENLEGDLDTDGIKVVGVCVGNFGDELDDLSSCEVFGV
jgi:hypothetical protein